MQSMNFEFIDVSEAQISPRAREENIKEPILLKSTQKLRFQRFKKNFHETSHKIRTKNKSTRSANETVADYYECQNCDKLGERGDNIFGESVTAGNRDIRGQRMFGEQRHNFHLLFSLLSQAVPSQAMMAVVA
uniref:Uncharacterized protein n=1 Tax=Romanomermis culicivorax TaxID=13658 RepID=A0A915J9R1_ROMCU